MERVSQFVDLITPDPDDIPPNEQLREASRHIVNFLDGSPEPVMETTCILCRDPYYFCGKLVSLVSMSDDMLALTNFYLPFQKCRIKFYVY